MDPATGCCDLGMPKLYNSNLRAVEIWSDINLFGWEFTRDVHDLELTPEARGDLLIKIRTLADEAAKLQKERVDQARAKSEARNNARNTAAR